MEKRYRWILALVIGMFVFMGQANAALTLTIDNYTNDEITFTISGTFDADTIGDSPGYLAIKNDWSNNQGVATEWFSSLPTATLNTITIGGLLPPITIQDGVSTWMDDIIFSNPLGPEVPILAGTAVTGSVTLTAAGAFNPADAATLELISGFSRPAGANDWVRLEASAAPNEEPVLLGVNSGSGGQFLASIDVATADLTNLGGTGLIIDGIAWGDGVLYATDNTNNRLVTLDPDTGALDTVIGSYGDSSTFEAMAYRSSDGSLFGIDLSLNNLVLIDTTSGAYSVIGALGTTANFAGLSFALDGTLYSIAHSGGDLYTIDPVTGAASLVATGSGGGIGPLGLAAHPTTGVLYSATFVGSNSDGLLETVNPVTAVRTLVGSMVGGFQIEGLTFQRDVVISQVADLTISKLDSVDPVLAGAELIYTIRVDNIGTGPAADVVVTDTLPAGVTLVSTTGCAEDPAGVPTCSLGTIDAAGFAEYTITVTVDPSTTGLITNNASVTTSSEESNPDNNSTSQDTTVSGEADLSITKMDSSDPFIAGGNRVLVYTIEVSNAGPSDATNVVVTDTLPSVAIFESTAGCLNDPNGVPDCQLGTIAAGASASYTITVTLQRVGGTIVNTVSVVSDAFDPDSGNSSVSETTEVTAIPIPTLGVLGLAALILLLGSIGWVSIRRS